MISKEEMYDFASQIAGISDSDLEVYKCGGKAHKTKKMECGAKAKKITKALGGRRLVDSSNAPVFVPRFVEPLEEFKDTYSGERIPVSFRAKDGYKEDSYTTYVDGKRVLVYKIALRSPLGLVGEWFVLYYDKKGAPAGSRRYIPGKNGYDEFNRGAYKEFLKALDYDYRKSGGRNRK